MRRLYIERFQQQFTQGHNGPRYGWLLDHPQMQMVIDVAPDRKSAKVRGRSMMQAGLHETAAGQPRAWWEGGIYANDYIRDGGIWKIKALRYFRSGMGVLLRAGRRRLLWISSRCPRSCIQKIRSARTH